MSALAPEIRPGQMGGRIFRVLGDSLGQRGELMLARGMPEHRPDARSQQCRGEKENEEPRAVALRRVLASRSLHCNSPVFRVPRNMHESLPSGMVSEPEGEPAMETNERTWLFSWGATRIEVEPSEGLTGGGRWG